MKTLTLYTGALFTDGIPKMYIQNSTAGVPEAGIGIGLTFTCKTSNSPVNYENGADIELVSTDLTSGSEDFDVVFRSMVAGTSRIEHFRYGSNRVGFFGVPTVARQVVPTGSTTDDVITALQNLGLFSQT